MIAKVYTGRQASLETKIKVQVDDDDDDCRVLASYLLALGSAHGDLSRFSPFHLSVGFASCISAMCVARLKHALRPRLSGESDIHVGLQYALFRHRGLSSVLRFRRYGSHVQ